jgi:DNA-directed RNA polymerase specialized sigma24 family protein
MDRNGPSIDPDRLRRAAKTLRRKELQVLILSAAEGLRNEQIAARLGITPRAAERLLAQALCKLDRALERLDRPWWLFW